MRLKKDLIAIFRKSFLLVSSTPLVWIFFYGFALFGLLISNNSIYTKDKILTLLFALLTIGLPALKVEFLDSIYKKKKPQYQDTLKLLFYYFKKLIGFAVLLALLFGLLFSLIQLMFYIFPNLLTARILNYPFFQFSTILVVLPLSIIYFSLFHLFFVILVIEKKGVIESLQKSIVFLKKNIVFASIFIVFSLLIRYPVSDLMMSLINKIPFEFNHLLVKSLLSFFNVLIDLFFFSLWLVLYKKKS